MVSCGNYNTLIGKWDLYIPFVELSIKLIKSKGYSSLIIPDAYCHADYSTKSLKIFTDNGFLERIDYYPNIDVFTNVGVNSVIVSFKKDKSNKKFITRTHKENTIFIEKIFEIYPKSFRFDFVESLIDNIENSIGINDVLYLSKGIVGNSCEKKYKGEFKVGDLLSNKKDQAHKKLYYEGKNINRWFLDIERWIEYGTKRSPSKWSRKGFPEFFEANKIVVMRSPGRVPRAFIDTQHGIFNESAIGFVRWIDLKGVENQSISKSYINEQERLKFEEISSSLNLNYLLAIINSKLIKYELNADRRSNIHIYPDDWRKLRIIPIDKQAQEPFIACIEHISKDTLEVVVLGSRFIHRLKDTFELDKISKKLNSFYDYDFKTLLSELKKQKITLSLIQQDEWEDYFNTYKTEINHLQTQITQTDQQIDQMVYELYGLTDEEIEIVEGS